MDATLSLLRRAKLRRSTSTSFATHIKPAYSQLPDSGGKHQILVVDDDLTFGKIMTRLLTMNGYVPRVVHGGQQALEVLDEPHIPDIILLDVVLPNVTGTAICDVIRERYSSTDLPIIMISSKDEVADIVSGLTCGANDYITKPVDCAEMIARIGVQLVAKKALEAARMKQKALIERMLPHHIIGRLEDGEQLIADSHEEVTILFSDIVNFTSMCSTYPTEHIIMMLDEMFSAFDDLCDLHKVIKVETVGDAYMVACGSNGESDHAVRMMRMAASMLKACTNIHVQGMTETVRIRVGIHTGPAYSGVVGKKCPRFCFFGDTVNTASRMESHGYPMSIHISPSTYDKLTGVGYEEQELVNCGPRRIKGKGVMSTYMAKVGEWQLALELIRRERDAEAPPPALTQLMDSVSVPKGSEKLGMGVLDWELRAGTVSPIPGRSSTNLAWDIENLASLAPALMKFQAMDTKDSDTDAIVVIHKLC